MKRIVFVLPLLVFIGVVAAFVLGLGRDPSKLPSMLIGKPLPQFSLPPVRDGDQGLSSADLHGRGPRLLNVFASWCVSCRIEHPVLLEMKAQGIVIDGLDWKDEAAAGARYLADNGNPYSRAGNDKSGRTGIDLGVTGVPETFVVDREGRVRFKEVGPIGPDDYKETIKPLLEKLGARS
jgi:cytochrome c biogenesis protein CcmG/thiol:disulfide interchange protein DsbE